MYLEVIGCFSPNMRLKPTTCYKISITNKILFLDMGYGNLNKIKSMDLNNAYVIISHNHVDHVLGLIELARYLKRKNKKLDNKITVYMPKNNKGYNLFNYMQKFSKWFNIYPITEKTNITVDSIRITFCPTIHKGETYAIKLVDKSNSFVYTSDIAKVDERLERFLKGVDTILTEGGHPQNKVFSLGDYHGYTSNIISSILKLNPTKLIISHLKAYANDALYWRYIPVNFNTEIQIVKLNKVYSI